MDFDVIVLGETPDEKAAQGRFPGPHVSHDDVKSPPEPERYFKLLKT
jgi:hypothetical protein